MKVFMVGGTGLLGSEAAKQFIKIGHDVTTVALPPIPEGADIPKELNIVFGNILDMTDNEVLKLMENSEVFVFAAGVDERVEFVTPKNPNENDPKNVYEFYHKHNIALLERLIKLAKSIGVKRTVVLGSYFTHFDTIWPSLNLYYHHPYIRSRVDQLNMALSYADESHKVAVLELPYIFGAQKGRKPVWMIFKDLIDSMPKAIYYPKGGTTMVTVKQVGQAIVGAGTLPIESKAYPVGWYNMTGKELMKLVTKFDGRPNRKVITIPTFLYKLYSKKLRKDFAKKGVESGLEPVKFVDLMTLNCFIGKNLIETELGVKPDDIELAIKDSITYCKEIKENNKKVVEMSGNTK